MGAPAEPTRLHSLDQFRGYTVLGMFVVNFLGGFVAIPAWLKHHHTYCSYADTIMPQFLFAVGFAYRLTFLRRQARDGALSAYWHALWRGLGLVLIGAIVYRVGKLEPRTWEALNGPELWKSLGAGLKRDVFQALTHIGVTILWALPVIALSAGPRILFAALSGLAHLVLSWQGYYIWVNTPPNGIDGGPLGFLTWTIPLITGTLTCDAFLAHEPGGQLRTDPPWAKLLAWALVLMAVGYALSCLNRVTAPNTPEGPLDVFLEPPFVPPSEPVNLWTMSQRSGSLTYLTFSAGFSLAVFLLFWLACDRWGLQLGIFRTLGQNALVAYIIHDLVSDLIKPYAPRDCPLWYALLALATFLLVCYTCLRHLEKHRLYLRL